MADDSDELKKLKSKLELEKKIQGVRDQTSSNLTSYLNALTKGNELHEAEIELLEEVAQLKKELATATDKDSKEYLEGLIKTKELEAEGAKRANEARKESLSLSKAIGGSIKQQLLDSESTLQTTLKNNFGWRELWSTLMEADKSIKSAQLSMGLFGESTSNMSAALNGAAGYAAALGVSVAELAAAQEDYSRSLGRNVILSKESYKAITQISKGLGISVAEATGLASEMDLFGLGASDAAEVMNDLVNSSAKMGVSTAKVTELMKENMGLMNKFRFQNGIRGLTKMAQLSAKFKIDMQDVATVAEAAFRPEGAIEMAANLQVLGGNLAKLGDPFQLMFKARHDMVGLTEDILKATDGLARFNKETGEFDVGAMEYDRLREASTALGIPMENLVKQAKSLGKIQHMKMRISASIPEELRSTLAASANMVNGKAMITINGVDRGLGEVTKDMAEAFKLENSSLEERAKASQTFDEVSKNLVESLKTGILPALEAMKPLINTFADFVVWLNKEGGGWTKAALSFGIGVAMLLPKMTTFLFQLKGLTGMGLGGGGASPVAQTQTARQVRAGGMASRAAGAGSMMSSLGSAASILAIGAAVMMFAKSIDMLAEASVKIKTAGSENIMIGLGVGLGVLVGGLYALTALIVGSGGTALVGLWSLAAVITSIGASVGLAAAGVGLLVEGMAAFNNPFGNLDENATHALKAIKNISMDKIDALKNLIDALGSGQPIKIEFSDLNVDGELLLAGKNGESVSAELFSNQIFISKLKEMILSTVDSDLNIKPNRL